MGFLNRLFGGGDEREREELRHAMQRVTLHDGRTPADQQAIERYRYLVRTAPPQAIEQAHEQAFAQLSPSSGEWFCTNCRKPCQRTSAVIGTTPNP
jgi:hypothetical protein